MRLVLLNYLQVDSEELLRSEAVALRVRGTLNLTSGQNENDLHIAFKHLIEKVGSRTKTYPHGFFLDRSVQCRFQFSCA